MLTVIIKIKIIMTIKIIIIVIKLNNTSNAKVIILKRTNVQIMTMPSKKSKKLSYLRTLPLQVQRSKGAKNRDLRTLS